MLEIRIAIFKCRYVFGFKYIGTKGELRADLHRCKVSHAVKLERHFNRATGEASIAPAHIVISGPDAINVA